MVAAGSIGAGVVLAQSGAQELSEMVVVANRLETPMENVGSTFSALEVELLERRGIVTLEDSLRLVPGTGKTESTLSLPKDQDPPEELQAAVSSKTDNGR